MQKSDMDNAGDDADRFQMSFYQFTDALQDAARKVNDLPGDLEAARLHELFKPYFEQIPEPLQLPLETEVELILEGKTRVEDNTQA